ncbi:MAG TPA: MFS transporter [Taishania sp.]|nr:MFS transporter [Taishania sp.]
MNFLRKYIESYKGLSQESWMLSLVMLINRSGAMVIPFLGIYLHQQMGFSIFDAGKCLSLYGFGSLFGSGVGGWLTDKFGNYRVQIVSLLLCSPLYILIPHFENFYSICLLLFLLGLFSEIFRPANSVAITRYAKKENLTRAFSLNRMAMNLGFSIGPAIGGVIAAYSFYWLFYINACSCCVAILVFVLFFRNRKERNEAIAEDGRTNHVNVANRSPYTDTKFLCFSLFCTLFALAFFQLLNTLPIFLKDGVGFTQKEVGLVLGYSGFIIVLTEMPLIAFVEKRLSIIQVMFWGTIITGLNFFLYTISHQWFLVYLAITLMSIGEMLVLPFMATVTSLRSGPNNRGSYMGVNGISVGIALIVSPLLGTSIAEHLGYDMLWLLTALLLVVTAVGFYFSIKSLKEVTEFK